tara:strand:+ start:503 stop:1465 length:963 start_codon:yes stop_codon:yes gene_type:complete
VNKNYRKIAGVTLIEMLIGIVVSSIIIAAMYTTYTVVNNSYSQVTDVASVSRSGRDVIAMLMRDIRMAGFKYYYGFNAENESKPLEERIPRQEYLTFIAGDNEADREDSMAPIVIYPDTLDYGTAEVQPGYDPIEADAELNRMCCDRIHIVYGDFDANEMAKTDKQPYKKYRITYFARALSKGGDQYYGLYRSKESWVQPLNILDPALSFGDWKFDCPECYQGELVREYLTDMSFTAIGQYGQIIKADPVSNAENIYDIRSVDVSLTFRSSAKKGFFRNLADGDKPRIVKSLGREAVELFDKFFRDTIFVTVHTRNIGSI